MGEFDLIRRYFQRPAAAGVEVGVGDDCAVLLPTPGACWLVSSDMLVEGRHFLSTVDAARLGHKALAVNLSDLAACGATPRGFTLALALPRADEDWLAGFARGLLALADAHDCPLIGGDTTQGPLNICITVFGEAPPGQALLRSGARVGDDIWVSGRLGDARLALEVFRGTAALAGDGFEAVRAAMECPTPRVALGQALRGIATSALDVSDGLLGDLGHILAASGVGACINADALPRSAVLAAQPLALQRECGLAGGDDYELVFTAPPGAALPDVGIALTRIGRIEAEPGLRVVDGGGEPVVHGLRSFDHFAS
ncbi:thiamine-phosphate kinase [Roseateles asaccharophilus]|uniref:Thiamine-monophosphate kinase n=1 Tax=Roseateles asaccharophilus TaxID=582607 RepID=A0ABU2AD23_9BURK|nr:thiamine-phosphate kinase [Roseateles asaccharophilus]MDR7335085.1 thiamine-monophosphate kinase [Roseateles asaccharophilus]